MKYRGYTIYAEGALNNWCDFEEVDGELEITDFISDGGCPDADNISSFGQHIQLRNFVTG
ncbi:MAG: hypothetical protein ACLP9Y_27495 [Mycobacterium sp.]|uniref:hypothetical protein n=1 Tax=Mycobacterium sp. TaxID=1785 RepID=UPI003F9557C3